MAKHPVTEDVYIWRATDLLRWNQAVNTHEVLSKGGMVSLGRHSMAVDDRRNRLFACANGFDQANRGAWVVDLTTFVDSPVTLTGSAADVAVVSGSDNTADQYGMEFVKHPTDASQDCFILRRHQSSGGNVYRINAVTFAVDVPATTGGGTIPVAAATNPICNRFRYAPNLGCIIFPVHQDHNVWALRVI
jgi:hypothetical protein